MLSIKVRTLNTLHSEIKNSQEKFAQKRIPFTQKEFNKQKYFFYLFFQDC